MFRTILRPDRIAALEEEHRRLTDQIAAPEFYLEGQDAIAATLARVDAVQDELLAAYERLDELNARSKIRSS